MNNGLERVLNFEGNEIKVRTSAGIELFNLANSAKVLGLTRKDNNRGTERIMWKGNRSLYDKLSKISSTLDKTECGANAPQEYIDELVQLLQDIEETDDRNSLYCSRYLTSRLAMECHSDKANAYKDWLAQLDERYSKGELTNGNQIEQLGNIANQMNLVASTMGQIGQAFVGLQEFVKDSIQAKDFQIDNIKELCGMKSANTMSLSKCLKEHLETIFDKKLWANSYEYKEAKCNIFKVFNVSKWEDIPIEKYKEVQNYINDLGGEDIMGNTEKAGVL